MAGSDFHRRSRPVQDDVPAEIAGPETVVQVAVIHRGREISVFHNGVLLSRHAGGECGWAYVVGDIRVALINLSCGTFKVGSRTEGRPIRTGPTHELAMKQPAAEGEDGSGFATTTCFLRRISTRRTHVWRAGDAAASVVDLRG